MAFPRAASRRQTSIDSLWTSSLLVFYVIHVATAGTLPSGWAWPTFAAPGFLFLLAWHLSRKTSIAAV